MRAVIFANGTFNKSANILSELGEDDLLIAADGGALNCLAAGLWPGTMIGDLDSISPSQVQDLISHGTQILEYPRDKDQTDLELALSYTVQQGVKEIIFLGLLGGRLDQSLANLLLLTRDEWNDLHFVISDQPDSAYLMRDNQKFTLEGNPGDIVSLIPITGTVSDVTTHGLRWQLDRAKLRRGNTLSVSNEMVEKFATIQIGLGKMYLIHRVVEEKDHEE
jgi:thiamine pyrophosphokinase